MKKLSKILATIMLMTAVVLAQGCKPDNNPNENENEIDNPEVVEIHEFVDLGLPSGTLWATCNVGASTPEGYGDFFAWGETQPKNTYTWSNYKYCSGSADQLTKYCSDPEFGSGGFTDQLTVLQASDDAATVHWGNDWHTPTSAQCNELKKHATHFWTTQNDVNGMKFTGPNGNSIFLPAAGICTENPNLIGTYGYYWTNELLSSKKADDFVFRTNGFMVDLYGTENREGGKCIRPVRSVK